MTKVGRRAVLSLLAAAGARFASAREGQRPRIEVSLRQIEDSVAARFPLSVGVPGLVVARFDAPRVAPLPERQKLSATLPARVQGANVGAANAGEIELAFALRYAPEDRTVRAHGFEVLSLRWPGLPPDVDAQLQALLPQLARQALVEVVLHRMSPEELALPDTMGFAPGTIEVTARGLVVWFVPK